MHITLDDLRKVMHIIVPLKIYSLHHDRRNDPEYEAYRDDVRLYQTRLIEEALIRIASGADAVFSKNYAKALFDEYVFQRIDYTDRQVVLNHYEFIIKDELLKQKLRRNNYV